ADAEALPATSWVGLATITGLQPLNHCTIAQLQSRATWRKSDPLPYGLSLKRKGSLGWRLTHARPIEHSRGRQDYSTLGGGSRQDALNEDREPEPTRH